MQQASGFHGRVLALARVGLGGAAVEQLLGFVGISVAQDCLGAEQLGDLRFVLVKLMCRNSGGAADNERRARLINQDRIHFVHNGKEMAALDLRFGAGCHAVVAEIIKAELGVRPIGDIAHVLLAAQRRRLIVLNDAHGQAEKFEDFPHPLRVTGGQVIVDGHEMDVVAGQRIEIERHRGHQCLALAGRHFRDIAPMQHHATNQLHIKRHHLPLVRPAAHQPFAAAHAPAGILHNRKRFRQKSVENFLLQRLRFALERLGFFGAEFPFQFADLDVKLMDPLRLAGGFNALLELGRLRAQLIVA